MNRLRCRGSAHRSTPTRRRGARVCGLLAAACFLLPGGATAAEVPFPSSGAGVGYMTSMPTVVHADDLDGDGDLDVLAASESANELRWYQNDGASPPSFDNHLIVNNLNQDIRPLGPVSVFAADLDGDGDKDVLSASVTDGKIAWYENQGGPNPSFLIASTTRIATVSGARSVFSADVDGDGDLDVLSASGGDDRVAWYENDGSSPPAFTTRTLSTAADGAASVFATDVDGDGDTDVLSASGNDDKIAWYENDGATPPGWTARTITTTADGAQSVFAADVDGDGDTDVLSASGNDDKIAWYENDGATPPGWTARTITTTADGALSVFAKDVDGDGDTDVLSASFNDSTIAWYENDGGAPPTFTKYVVTFFFNGRGLFAADLDGDGDADVITTYGAPDVIYWYENKTIHRNAVFPEQSVISTSGDCPNSIAAGDVDGDGDLDVLSSSTLSDTIAWHENDGGSPPAWTDHTVSAEDNGNVWMFTSDVDGDGDLDFLTAESGGSEIAWYDNTAGDGTAWAKHSIVTFINNSPQSIFGGDVDGDGDMDAVSGDINKHTVFWHENAAGDGSVWTTRTITVGTTTFVEDVYGGDVDGDGDLDVLVASQLGPEIAWYENDGSSPPNWTGHTISTARSQPKAVAAADVDGDGDLDALSASRVDDTIAWYENAAGDGTAWIDRTITTTADEAFDVSSADLDRDGDLDVLSASFFDDTVAWYENTAGDGTAWTVHTITTNTDLARAVFAEDLDGDGDQDVVSASSADDTIAWYENRGGQFGLPTSDTAPVVILEGETDDLLKIVATHNGRSGDTDLELVTLELLFEETPGDPLGSAEANALIDTLDIYLDDGSGQFEIGTDTLVTTVGTIALTGGLQTVTFADGDPNVQVVQGTLRNYFVVTELTSNASAQTPKTFRATHVTASSSTGEDRDNDIPLALEYASDVSTRVVLAASPTSDADNDGLLDIYETGTGVFVSPADTGTDPLAPDTDGDTYLDGYEVSQGSDPNDPESQPSTIPALSWWGVGLFLLLLLAGRRLGRRRVARS